MSEGPHPPGSPRLDALSSHVLDAFNSFGLDHSWTDSHYVGLQRPDRLVRLMLGVTGGGGGKQGLGEPFNPFYTPLYFRGRPTFLHRVEASGAVIEELQLEDPEVYCPYSASGTIVVMPAALPTGQHSLQACKQGTFGAQIQRFGGTNPLQCTQSRVGAAPEQGWGLQTRPL